MAQEQKDFNTLFDRISQSATYARFCERVYGRDLSQFNALDEEQMQFLVSFISSVNPQSILDLGCGLGRISEFIAQNSDASVLGVDFADEIIARLSLRHCQQRNLNFRVGDLNALSGDLGRFDLIIAIDTFCFATKPDQLISGLLRNHLASNGRLIVFHSYRNKAEGATAPLGPAECNVGRALSESGFTYDVCDFTENEKQLWQKCLVVANELRASFEEEDQHSTCEERIWEAERNLNWFREGRYRRSMFITKPRGR